MASKHREPLRHGIAHVPVVMQMEALECGAASLGMILAYYGRWVPLTQLRKDLGVSRNGANAMNILDAAKLYGLNSKGYRYGIESLRKKGTFPCIIHWNFCHFLVLDGFRGNKAYLNDPAGGSYAVSMEQFDEGYTGICLFFEPGENFQPGGRQTSILAFAKERLKGSKTAILFTVCTTVLLSLLGIFSPVFSLVFVDSILGSGYQQWLTPLLLLLAGFAVCTLTVSLIKTIYSYKINAKFSVLANAKFEWHLLRLPVEFFSQRMSGDIETTQESNESISNTFIQTFAPLILNLALMLLYLFAMINYSPLIALIAVAAVTINLLVSLQLSKKKINVTRVQTNANGKLNGTTIAGIEMVETIKASGAENGFFEKWAGYQAKVISQQQQFIRLENSLGLVPELVTSLTGSIVLAVGVYLSLQGKFSLGMIVAFQGFLMGFMTPASSIINATKTVQEMRTNMERVQDIMEYPPDVIPEKLDSGVVYEKLRGDIELKNVTFGYSRLDPPLIENLSLHILPGQKIAFVGASGCGKSTLTKLISGLYQPWSGEVLLDGKPLQEISRSVLTGSVAVVEQDIMLFEDSIADNIRMWDKTIENFDVILAARDADIHEDIMRRTGGYEYRLSEGGRNFSGGQRQRLEIARVLAQDPTIIIMDEATSALDAKTEYDVVRKIQDRGITEIVIAHRLSTIRDCDIIYMMDRGVITEQGTHEELFAKGGLYTQLISSE